MPTFQPGMDIVYDNEHDVKCNKCAKIFVAATFITIVDMLFVICCSFVYMKEYVLTVKNTYNVETDSYVIAKPFVILYFWEAVCSMLILLWIVFFIVWLIFNTVC